MTRKTGLIGHPVSHSLSPLIHTHWLHKYRIDGSYTAIDSAPDDLAARVRALADEGYVGFNVTLPHKEEISFLCDGLDDTAQAVGAVNTVTIDENGRLYGHNTDVDGFINHLKSSVPDFDLSGKHAVVLGAGGAARAVLYALLREDFEWITLINRTRERAVAVANDLDDDGRVLIVDWEKRGGALADTDLLVNTTSLGMTGQAPLDMDVGGLSPNAVVYDIVYRPLMTPLLQQAKMRGNTIVTGLGMLLHQARPAFDAWYGVMPHVDDELESIVMERLVES